MARIGWIAAALALASASQAGVVSDHGRLRVAGNKIVDSLGRPVQLAGMSLYWPQWASSGKNFYTAAAVQALATDWKASLVRAPMPVYTPNSTPAVQLNRATYTPMVKTVIDAAIANDIYVVVDWHVEGDTVMADSAKAFFQDIASSYPGCPNIIWEIWNEPINSTWATIRTYTQGLLSVIRPLSRNIVVVGSTGWSHRPQYGAAAPIAGDSAIAYAAHFYACSDTSDFQATIRTTAAKVPVFLSEWGTTSSDGRTGYCQGWAESWLALADSLDLSWANWSFSNIGGNSQALTGTSFTSTTSSGTFVKARIQQVYAKLAGTVSTRGRAAGSQALVAHPAGRGLRVVAPEGIREIQVTDPSGRLLARSPALPGGTLLEPGARGLLFVRAAGPSGNGSTAVILPP